MNATAVVILAAGQGKRMKTDLPKVIHQVAGKPLVAYPLDLARATGAAPIVVVVGHGRSQVEEVVRKHAGSADVRFAVQQKQLGTGHAVMAGLTKLASHKGNVLVLSGDVPLLTHNSVHKLTRAFNRAGAPVAFVSFVPDDPGAYGRVIRDGKKAMAIREFRDCTKEQREIREVNAGIYLFDIGFLRRAIKKLQTDNAQGELYLTDLVEVAARKHKVVAVEIPSYEVGGVNDRVDLAKIDEILQAQITQTHMKAGVTIRRPATVWIDAGVKIGKDTEIEPGVSLKGTTTVATGCRIETGAVVTDSSLDKGAVIRAYSVVDGAKVGKGAEVGPMGRLRPGAVLKTGAKVGNFVELKNTVLGKGSKANHLAYLGDGQIGDGVNIGAGTIFCNYDGFLKHKTVLEDDVFIGSDSQLVAPVTVGKGAYVASGSTIVKDVPPGALAIARVRQTNKLLLAVKLKQNLAARKAAVVAAKQEKGQG